MCVCVFRKVNNLVENFYGFCKYSENHFQNFKAQRLV